MAACDGLEHIFGKPLPLESIPPWKHVKPMKTVDDHYSFTEIFGQLYLKENNNHVLDSHESSPSSSPFPSSPSLSSSLTSTNSPFPNDENQEKKQQRRDSISSMNSESVSTCTEELGFESSDEDSIKNESCNITDWQAEDDHRRRSFSYRACKSKRDSRRNRACFPPPISCIGRSGKPWVCFESVREDGRFILMEVRIPTQEFLHACRKNGRLKMQLVQSDDEFLDDEDEEEEDAEEDDEGTSEVEDGDMQGTCV